jgi:peroxiredoxin
VRRPRKVFLLIGSVAAAILAVGLFTSLGTSHTTASQVGGPAPDFSLPTVAGTGRVGTPGSGGGHGTPAVLLFFGSWCSVCHSELPPLAATVRKQQQAHGALSRIAVIGVDSYDTRSTAGSFLRASGVTFPVALDSVAQVTNGLYAFTGDPETVFIGGDGTISAIKLGPLSPAAFVSLERRLLAGP